MYKHYESKLTLPETVYFPFSSIHSGGGGGVLLYGAGNIGQSYYREATNANHVKIVQWCDSNASGKNLSVISPKQIDWDGFEYVVIAINSIKAAKEIYAFFKSKGVESEKIIWSPEWPSSFLELDEKFIEKVAAPAYKQAIKVTNHLSGENQNRLLSSLIKNFVEKKQFILPRLVVVLGTHCTLKCKYCNNLMPYYKKQYWLDAQKIIDDIKEILKNVDGIITVEFIGGEPFIYPELEKILKFAESQEKIWEVELTTNATVIPKDEILTILQNPKMFARVSDYSTVTTTNKFIEKLEENNIRYTIMRELMWRDSGEPIKNGKSENHLRYIYADCENSKVCKTLLKGKIYACARSASLYDLGYLDDTEGYIDIYEQADLKNALKIFFADKDIDTACDYCNSTDIWRTIKAGEQAAD